jgi:3-oxoacyl-[acyl-carrier protein] reductase
MDLGIAGRTALVCAASRGLGWACAHHLVRAGVAVTITARDGAALEAAAERLRGSVPGAVVRTSAGDITTPAGRQAALARCPAPDILVNNAGGPPPGDFRAWSEADWQAAVNANMVTPIMLIRAIVDGMIERRFGRIVNITSSAVKAPISGLGLSNGARTGLTGFVAGLARQVAQHGVTVNNLLPGPFDTDRLRTAAAAARAKAGGGTADDAVAALAAANPTRRIGDPDEFGAVCAFYCSRYAGYMTGQNILLDGGAYPGTF